MHQFIGKSITVKGKVQGVFFRASTLVEAKKLGLVGWVKNETNGDVQIEVFGNLDTVLELIEWCKTGSDFSQVDSVSSEDIEAREESDFRIAH